MPNVGVGTGLFPLVLPNGGGVSGPFGGHATLTNNLEHYWILDEASGDRADSVGTSTLTDNNTVGSAAKGAVSPANMPDTVASFVSLNSEHLSHAGIAIADPNEWTVSLWYKLAGDPPGGGGTDSNCIIFLAGNATSTGAYIYATANSFFYGVPTATLSPPLSTTGWHHAIIEQTGGVSYVYFDGAAPATPSAANVQNAAASYAIDMPSVFAFGDVDISSVGWWSRGLTAGERAALYNSGAGLFY